MKITTRLFLIIPAACFLFLFSSYKEKERKNAAHSAKHALPGPSSFKVVGYLPTWAGKVEDIQFSKLTHINYAFLIPTADGGYKPLTNAAKLTSLVTAAHANGVKVLISVAGGSGGDAFKTIVPDPALRTAFVNSMIRFADENQLDGVDIDWEYPREGTEADNFLLMMQELTAAMHKEGKLCTIAVIGDDGAHIVNGIFDTVDYLMIMAYDANKFQHSTYDIAVQSLNYWRGRGVPKEKAILGVPFYGRDSTAEYKTANYKDLLTRGGNANEDAFQTVGYNGIPTMKSKTNLAFDQAGGIMIWELNGDAPGANSLLSAIHEVVVSKTGVPGVPPANVTPTMKTVH